MNKVLLSFDIEEFDMPLEYDHQISFGEQIQISTKGCESILDILLQHKVQATFFSTVTFAKNAPHIIERILKEGHELASHGVYHSSFEVSDLHDSRTQLEQLSGQSIKGFRMARMMPVSDDAIKDAGYKYNSSLNPVYLPGRYNNFFKPRTLFLKSGVVQFPASATPLVRFPLFWLSFHNLPLSLYKSACSLTMNKDRYLNIYFHPWEFTELESKFNLPGFVTKNSGSKMIKRFGLLIDWMKSKGYTFSTISSFLESRN